MATPKFNGNPIFSSLDGSGSDATTITEGVLWVMDYSYIGQTIHFEGELGDRFLSHGQHSRKWMFMGLLSADTLVGLDLLLQSIQSNIDLANTNPTDYYPLIDSFGHTFPNAQVHNLTINNCHITDTHGYVAEIVVTGIVQGMPQEADVEGS